MTVMQDNIREAMTREKDLRRSAENRLVDALETSREGVMLVASDGKVVMANSTLRGFFPAIAYQLMPGTQFDTALALIQSQLAPTQAASEDVATSGHAELELADGRWLRMTGSATSEGGSIFFLSDFTAIKEREESLRRAKREAEAANASKSRFLANMSHELRTPLNAIIGFSEIINGQFFGEVGNERYLDYSGDILRSGRHLLAVINDVLDLSKSEAGKMVLTARETDMAEVLDDCIAMVREQCADAGLHFTVAGLDQPLCPERRSRQAAPDLPQPAVQRHQIHRKGRHGFAGGRGLGQQHRGDGGRHRHRHEPGGCRDRLPALWPGR